MQLSVSELVADLNIQYKHWVKEVHMENIVK